MNPRVQSWFVSCSEAFDLTIGRFEHVLIFRTAELGFTGLHIEIQKKSVFQSNLLFHGDWYTKLVAIAIRRHGINIGHHGRALRRDDNVVRVASQRVPYLVPPVKFENEAIVLSNAQVGVLCCNLRSLVYRGKKPSLAGVNFRRVFQVLKRRSRASFKFRHSNRAILRLLAPYYLTPLVVQLGDGDFNFAWEGELQVYGIWCNTAPCLRDPFIKLISGAVLCRAKVNTLWNRYMDFVMQIA